MDGKTINIDIWNQSVQHKLYECWDTMKDCAKTGLDKKNPIKASDTELFEREAHNFYKKANGIKDQCIRKENLLLEAYARAVAEQNGSAEHEIVTAPTCGAAGVVPGVFYYIYEH